MTPERHARRGEIFLKAVELPPSLRAAFLDDACSGDSEMRADVESLLDHDLGEPTSDRNSL